MEVLLKLFNADPATAMATLAANAPITVQPKAQAYEAVVDSAVASLSEGLAIISHEIWSHPELGYEEVLAHKLITDFLEKEGTKVTRGYKDLSTAFLAEYQTPGFDAKSHPTLAFLCEYDALPEIGHACGHNLIAVVGMSSFLATKRALETSNGQLNARIVCMGTPAEEMFGGKPDLLRKGAFEGIDFALMAHGAPIDIVVPDILGVTEYHVEYFGKAAHASCGPWEGINALDAAVAAYQGVALMRQGLSPSAQVQAVIINGGAKPNIIPEYTKSEYGLRAATVVEMDILKKKFHDVINAAAASTNCRVKITEIGNSLTGLMANKVMSAYYKSYGQKKGMFFPENIPKTNGSTDMGNVSIVVPSIHPAFFVGLPPAMIHTKAFQEVAGKPDGVKCALRCGSTLAMVALELIVSEELRAQARKDFEMTRKTFTGAEH